MAKPGIDVQGMTPQQRLELLEKIWDSLTEDPNNIPLTDSQRQELDRRLDDFEQDGEKGIPWEEVLDRIRRRLA